MNYYGAILLRMRSQLSENVVIFLLENFTPPNKERKFWRSFHGSDDANCKLSYRNNHESSLGKLEHSRRNVLVYFIFQQHVVIAVPRSTERVICSSRRAFTRPSPQLSRLSLVHVLS